MAILSMMGEDDPRKKKKKKNVDACVDGKCGPKNKAVRSFSVFSPTKKKYNIPETKEEKPEPTGGLHQNMRDLGGNPGDNRVYAKDAKSAVTPAQETEGRKANLETRKNKKALKMPRKKFKVS